MKSLLITLFVLTASLLTAQSTITWKGGTPGKETCWDEPRNWSGQRVPNEFSHVIIKRMNSGHDAQPVISGEVVVAGIEIQPMAKLIVAESGNLTIDCEYSHSASLENRGGHFINRGAFTILNADESSNSGAISLRHLKN